MRSKLALPQLEFTPVFDWSPPRRRKVSLFSFLAASVALHALCFYLFQIIYPPTVALLPPPARVNVITGASEDGRVLLRWIEAEDPALSSTTQRPPGTASALPPTAAHVPSYANYQPVLRELPPYQPDLSIPSAQPSGPVPMKRSTAPTPAPTTATLFRFGNQSEPLTPMTVPALQFTARTNEPPQAAQFRIAIGATGEVRYCFLDSSSGDAALDEQARRYLVQCRFGFTDNPTALLWTTATVEWGNDIALPAPRPVPTPTP